MATLKAQIVLLTADLSSKLQISACTASVIVVRMLKTATRIGSVSYLFPYNCHIHYLKNLL